MPTMLPGAGAPDIRVKPSDSRVADIHLRGQLIAKSTFLEQKRIFHCASLGTFVLGITALRGSYIL